MLPARYNAMMFTWLVRRTTGTSHPHRGEIDSASGRVRFYIPYRPIRPAADVEKSLRGTRRRPVGKETGNETPRGGIETGNKTARKMRECLMHQLRKNLNKTRQIGLSVVAKVGGSGPRGRRFKSCHPDCLTYRRPVRGKAVLAKNAIFCLTRPKKRATGCRSENPNNKATETFEFQMRRRAQLYFLTSLAAIVVGVVGSADSAAPPASCSQPSPHRHRHPRRNR